MRKSYTLSDGTKLTTSSGCRFVTFTISDDSHVSIYKRTDNPETADKNTASARNRGYLRVVTVDFAPFTPRGESQRPAKVRSDSSDWLPRF